MVMARRETVSGVGEDVPCKLYTVTATGNCLCYIAGVSLSDVGLAHIWVVILRRILGEVPAVKSLKVRP